MQIVLENLNFTYPDGKQILSDINLSLGTGEKAALVGDNGTGKSTLLRILTGDLSPTSGHVYINPSNRYLPQHTGQFNTQHAPDVLGVRAKLEALTAIEAGSIDPEHFATLDDDWSLPDRIAEVLSKHRVPDLVDLPLASLSGGEKSRLLLAGIDLHQPDLVLLDEPSNHLDQQGRLRLFDWIRTTHTSMLIVSHDRDLLALCNPIFELSNIGIKRYGGNFEFYETQKQAEIESLAQQIHHFERNITVSRKRMQQTLERQQRKNSRGSDKAIHEGIPKIMRNAMRNKAENATASLKDAHERSLTDQHEKLRQLRTHERQLRSVKLSIPDSELHAGKILFEATGLNLNFGDRWLWRDPLDLTIRSGDRLQITGSNGSGKSTLTRIITGEILPASGSIRTPLIAQKSGSAFFLLDQEYSHIDRTQTVLHQIEQFNNTNRPNHEIKTLLHRYLFDQNAWDRPCEQLSGGELMRLSLCCMTVNHHHPDLIILDEPTNNLDLRNIRILTDTIQNYHGTLIIISHDSNFVSQIQVNRVIEIA